MRRSNSARKLDYRLRISEPTAHFIANLASSSIKLLIEPTDTFYDEVDALLKSLGGDIEVPADLGYGAFEYPPDIFVRHTLRILNVPTKSNRRRPAIAPRKHS